MIYYTLLGAVFFLALLIAHEWRRAREAFSAAHLEVGDAIVYRKQKTSTRPSPRAYAIRPAGQGDDYSYFVDKFWTVENVLSDGRLVVTTRTRKHHYLRPDDPNLRKAGLIVRLRYRRRFPELAEAA
jgi:hypothetical protein